MSDSKLRELERRWRETKSVEDLAAFVRATVRVAPGSAMAVLSDVHGNLLALEAVLSDIERLGSPSILFLGDALGRGPMPRECVDLLRQKADAYCLGLWEAAVTGLLDPGFGRAAATTVEWIRSQLRTPLTGSEERWLWLRDRPADWSRNGIYARHHGIGQNSEATVFANDMTSERTRGILLASAPPGSRVLCVGGNYESWVFDSGSACVAKAREVGDSYSRASGCGPLVVSPGSVGCPRDGDPRAVYCILLGEDTVLWRRLNYDHETAARQFTAVPGTPRGWGERIARGV